MALPWPPLHSALLSVSLSAVLNRLTSGLCFQQHPNHHLGLTTYQQQCLYSEAQVTALLPLAHIPSRMTTSSRNLTKSKLRKLQTQQGPGCVPGHQSSHLRPPAAHFGFCRHKRFSSAYQVRIVGLSHSLPQRSFSAESNHIGQAGAGLINSATLSCYRAHAL